MKGRKRTLDSIKRIRGTEQKCRSTAIQRRFSHYNAPPPPDFMNEIGKRIYQDIINYLAGLQAMEAIDLFQVIAFSHYAGLFMELESRLGSDRAEMVESKSGRREMKKVDHCISMDLFDRAIRAASELGITPTMRGKIFGSVKQLNSEDEWFA